MTRIATFDIWETCLVRAYALPHHVFYEAARRVCGPDTGRGRWLDLARARIEAEQVARKARQAGENEADPEVTFDEIYSELAEALGDQALAGSLRKTELSVERESVSAVQSVLCRVRTARNACGFVVFVSDMYLPADFLEALLREHSFFEDGDRLFVSADFRKAKYSGRLYQEVAKRLGVPIQSLHHFGNNPQSDGHAALRSGASAEVFNDWELNRYENQAVDAVSSKPLACSRLAGLLRATRLSARELPGINSDALGFISGVAAPLLVGYVGWLLDDARQRGLKRLYFLSRDGEILLQIARALEAERQDALECRYLYSSRRCWGFPATIDASDACFRWLRRYRQKPDSLLRKLGFTDAERAGLLAETHLAGNQEALWIDELDGLWKTILSGENLETILERASAERSILLEYFEQEGLFDGTQWAIVDIGWNLHTHSALLRLVSQHTPSCPVFGYYLGTLGGRPPAAETAPFETFVAEDFEGSAPEMAISVVRQLVPLIEEVFLRLDDGTVTQFERDASGRVAPRKGPSELDDVQQAYCTEARRAARMLAVSLADSRFERPDWETVANLGLSNFALMARQPALAEVQFVQRFLHQTDHGDATTSPLVAPYCMAHVAEIIGSRLGKQWLTAPYQPNWEEGSRAVTPKWLLCLMRLAQLPLPGAAALKSIARKLLRR